MDEAEDYNGRMVVAGTGSAAAGSERSPLLFPQGGGEGEPAAPNWNPPPDGAAWPAADPEVSSSCRASTSRVCLREQWRGSKIQRHHFHCLMPLHHFPCSVMEIGTKQILEKKK